MSAVAHFQLLGILRNSKVSIIWKKGFKLSFTCIFKPATFKTSKPRAARLFPGQ